MLPVYQFLLFSAQCSELVKNPPSPVQTHY